MAYSDLNSADRLSQAMFVDDLYDTLGWNSTYAYGTETFGPSGMLGQANDREVVLVRGGTVATANAGDGLLNRKKCQNALFI
jgi:hypothetical protein